MTTPSSHDQASTNVMNDAPVSFSFIDYLCSNFGIDQQSALEPQCRRPRRAKARLRPN
jgi:hypothetical protein